MLKVGNAQAFWGDTPLAAAELLKQTPDLDYITLDYLSELSMSILVSQQQKNPSLGYAADFLDVIRSLIPLWKDGHIARVVTNAGGLNPLGCAKECKELLKECPQLKIGVVTGDNVLQYMKVQNPSINTAHAYLGADSIAEALNQGAHIVLTGRVADPSLTVGPCLHHFHWQNNDWDKLAGATIAGHLIECGTQVTGGFSTDWLDISFSPTIGFPIAEIEEDGACTITKPATSGGAVTERSVKEQLLYEIGDPSAYISPDVSVSFLELKVKESAPNHISIRGAKGTPPTDSYKVSATYPAGYKCEAYLTCFGYDLRAKSLKLTELIKQRLLVAGFSLECLRVECLGLGDSVPSVLSLPENRPGEVVFRFTAFDKDQAAVVAFAKEIAPLITAGPQGLTGYGSGRPPVRQVFGYSPSLIPKNKVSPQVTII